LLNYKYKKICPTPFVTVHTEKLTFFSSIKDLIVRILITKNIFVNSNRGPSEVEKRLIVNLQEINLPGSLQIDWILNVNSEEAWAALKIDFDNLILGPNIEFEKSYVRDKIQHSRNSLILVPSEWVIPVLRARLEWFKGRFVVWQSDIDANYWKSAKRYKQKQVLIYRKKDLFDDDFLAIKRSCNELRLKYKVVTYGKYSQNSFRRALRKSRLAIWLGTTESQGIALLECWSVNVPTFVRESNTYSDEISGKTFVSSSAPYLNPACGEFINMSTFTSESLRNFLLLSEHLKPREFVLQNYSKSKMSSELIELFTTLNS